MDNGYNFYIRGEYVEFIENPPDIPELFDHIWQCFLDLNKSRSGEGCISFSDMHAYFKLINVQPSRWDLSILQDLDNQFLYIRNAKSIDELTD